MTKYLTLVTALTLFLVPPSTSANEQNYPSFGKDSGTSEKAKRDKSFHQKKKPRQNKRRQARRDKWSSMPESRREALQKQRKSKSIGTKTRSMPGRERTGPRTSPRKRPKHRPMSRPGTLQRPRGR